MKHSTINRSLLAGAIALSLALGGCAATPESPAGALEVRNKLNTLKNNPDLADRTRVELRAAEDAVQLAEQPLTAEQSDLGAHRVYMADRKVEIAMARANTLHAEAQRDRLSRERDTARLDARTGEADRARASEIASAATSERLAEDMRRQIADLEAKVTDRGLVLTLGDVLFATGNAELQSGSNANLDKLVTFLAAHPDRNVLVEGHTDNVGGAAYNQTLSLRRAEAVSSYLVAKGIAEERLSSSGAGMDSPVADNSTASGRQQNRRVEIVIGNPQQSPG